MPPVPVLLAGLTHIMMTYSWGTAVTQVMNVSSAALVEREEGGESVTLNDQHDSHNLTWYITSHGIT